MCFSNFYLFGIPHSFTSFFPFNYKYKRLFLFVIVKISGKKTTIPLIILLFVTSSVSLPTLLSKTPKKCEMFYTLFSISQILEDNL